MRKSLGPIALLSIAALAAASLAPVGLADFSKALQDAQTLKADYTVQTIGGTAERYRVELKKPNLLRVDSPSQTLVSDGKNLTTYDKAAKSYYKQPVTSGLLADALAPEGLNLWAGFFNPKALTPVASKSLGARTRAGQSLEAVEATYDTKGKRVVTYFLNPTDKVARQAQVDLTTAGVKRTMVINAKDVQVGGTVGADAFAFKAPADSSETTLEAMSAAKWYTDIEEAKAMAAKTGKRIFVDFMASWCGPCKMLDAEVLQGDQFKELAGKKLILLRIDVDEQKAVSSAYSIEAMPTQMVLDAQGGVISKTVGYGGPSAFFAWLTPNAG